MLVSVSQAVAIYSQSSLPKRRRLKLRAFPGDLDSSFTILSAQSSCVGCVLKQKKERVDGAVTDRMFVMHRCPISPIPDVSAPETSGMCSVSFRDSRAAVTAVLGCRLHLLTPANYYWLARSCGVRRLQLKTSRESFLALLSARGSKQHYYIPLSNLTAPGSGGSPDSDPRGPRPRAGRRATNRRSPPGDAGGDGDALAPARATRAEAGRRRRRAPRQAMDGEPRVPGTERGTPSQTTASAASTESPGTLAGDTSAAAWPESPRHTAR